MDQGHQQTAAITSLPREAIVTDESTYQWRDTRWNALESESHIEGLERHLRNTGKAFDAIVVYPTEDGSRFVVIDGHHRLQAYEKAEWSQLIPVEVFQGTPEEAEEAALIANNKDKLSYTLRDRLEAAWRLSKVRHFEGRTYSKDRINELTGISTTQIANMRTVLNEHGDRVSGLSWAEVRQMKRDPDQDYGDDWKRAKAEKVAKELTRKASIHFVNDAEILAMALEIISDKLPLALMEHWKDFDPDFEGPKI